MNLAIIGSRSFNNYELLEEEVCYHTQRTKINKIISGGAQGADKLAERYAKEYLIPIEIIKPEWNKYGKSAGFKRNIHIIKKADMVIAFWNGKSKGTEHSIKLAIKYKIPVVIIPF